MPFQGFHACAVTTSTRLDRSLAQLNKSSRRQRQSLR